MKIQSQKQVYYFKSQLMVRFQKQGNKTLAFQNGNALPETIDEHIDRVSEQLKGSEFIRVHPEHIINTNCIVRIPGTTDNSVEMEGGESIPILAVTKENIISILKKHIDF